MKLFSRLCFLTLIIPAWLGAQNLPLGSWRVHLPYLSGTKVADGGERIYCVADKGLFYYDKKDLEVVRLSKVEGLSDNDIDIARYDKVNHVLVICYSDANIDLLYDDKTIVNIADIERANITGNKKNINEVLFQDNRAYLSCGFGIVVLDLVKQEVRETYYLGSTGTNPAVFDLTVDDQLNIYAASDSGVYVASLNNPSLNDFASWTRIFSGNGSFNHIIYFGNRVIANNNTTIVTGLDTIWQYLGGNWSSISVNPKVQSFHQSYGSLLITYLYGVIEYDQNLQVLATIDNNVYPTLYTNDALLDDSHVFWIADGAKGLMKYDGSNPPEFITPNGPKSVLVSGYDVSGDVLWVAHGPVAGGGILQNQYRPAIISSFENGTWASLSKENTDNTICNLDTFIDLTCIVADPADADHVYAGSYDRGVVEFNDGQLIYLYNKTTTNGVLQYIPTTDYIRVGGMVLDQQNNLWVGVAQVANMLNVKKPDGSWQGFTFPGVLKTTDYLGQALIDDYNQVWCINVNANDLGGIFIFNHNNTLEDLSDDHYRLAIDKAGYGGLPNKDVRAIAKDLDGSIWVGTATGVAVFYSPGSVFSGTNFDAQQVLIQYQGYNQYLLETEIVTAIAVDGANRKWFGTQNGGVFLMSADGTKQLENFNTSNSPILSNNVLRISINKITGEVFFGTDKGIISYRGTATEGTESCTDTYVYPNPVSENYDGPIAIKGLVANSNVKITDVSGSVIYETTAQGGQAIWNGRSLNGDKAHTGVYLVFCSDETGKNTCVTKMVFIN